MCIRDSWSAEIPTTEAGGPYTIEITSGTEQHTLQNVLLGEVWICAGQSNMSMPVRGFESQPIAGSLEAIVSSPCYPIRMYTADRTVSEHKEFNVKGRWMEAGVATTGAFSAVGFFFARTLCQALNVPVGMINLSWGGSTAQAWSSQELLMQFPEIDTTMNMQSKSPQRIPSALHNAMFHPVTGYGVRGVIWYQGESDAEIIDNAQNSMLLKTMISSWRKAFRNPEMPFVMIQLPRINDPSKIRAGWPEFREMQDAVAKTVPKVYSVNTIDLGSTNSDVHPPFKRPVGERAGNTALNKVYGKKIPCEGPALKAFKPSGSNILVQLDQAAGLTTTDGKEPAQFEIAGTDGTYHPAAAEIINRKGNTAVIRLSSPEVKSPKHARYCWNRFVTPNLVNGNQLPARPFRTDEPVLKK